MLGIFGRARTAALLCASLLAAPAAAEVLATKDEALSRAFPEADAVDRDTLYLSEEQRARIAERAGAEVDSRLFTVYRAVTDGDPVGYAFIDTRTVRSKPATFLVVLSPEGRVRQVRVLAWEEPPEYQPGERWLGQFEGGELSGDLRLGEAVQAMGGASLSSRTLTDGVRRALAVHAVMLAGEDG